jgi:hypothetical protein
MRNKRGKKERKNKKKKTVLLLLFRKFTLLLNINREQTQAHTHILPQTGPTPTPRQVYAHATEENVENVMYKVKGGAIVRESKRVVCCNINIGARC